MALLKKQEAISLELGDRISLQASYGNQALTLKTLGRFEDAMALFKKQEVICQELGYSAGLQVSYNNQALILQDQGQFEAALALLSNQEELCRQTGIRSVIGRIVDVLADMNALSPEQHRQTGFDELIRSVEARLTE